MILNLECGQQQVILENYETNMQTAIMHNSECSKLRNSTLIELSVLQKLSKKNITIATNY